MISPLELTVGDFALFRNPIPIHDDDNCGPGCVLGMILGFRYIEGRNEKDKQYSLDSVPISAENTSNRGIEVLATWKNVDADFQTKSIPGNGSFINIKFYVATVKMLHNFNLQDFADDIDKFLEKNNSVGD